MAFSKHKPVLLVAAAVLLMLAGCSNDAEIATLRSEANTANETARSVL